MKPESKARDKERKAKWYADHREQVKATAAKWQKEHPTERKAVKAKWNLQNKEKNKDTTAKYRAAHPGYSLKWHREHPEQSKAHKYKWAREHPECSIAALERRRARKEETIADLTKEQVSEMFKAGCFFCHRHDKLSVAHDVPVKRKGNTTRGNTFCLCRSCNSKMGTKTLAQMIKQLLLPF